MTYQAQTWAAGPAGGTPLSARRLNHIEAGITAAHDVVSVAQRVADDLGQQQTAAATWWQDVSGTGVAPAQSGNVVTCGMTGNGTYRSETVWGTSGTPSFKLGRGWYLAAEWDMFLDAGFNQQDTSSWNVLAQLHGPCKNGTWYPPPVELNFQNGSYRVSNSGNVPLPDGTTANLFDEWMPRLWIPDAVGAWHSWKIGVRVGGPGVGTVDVWVDGTHWVRGWRPAQGTFYTQPPTSATSTAQHDYVYFKTGLYGGQTSGTGKTVQHRGMRVTVHDTNSIKTWRL